jgi:lipopolysaccharide export system protein LptA
MAFALLLPDTGSSRSAEFDQPIRIEADRVELSEKSGIGTYTGNVRVQQGTLVLTADVVTVVAPEKVLQKVIATGDLATLRKRTEDGKEIVAQAKQMEYLVGPNKIVLTDSARLQQGGNEFISDRIEYDLLAQVVHAGDTTKGGRVEVTIVPAEIRELQDQ